MRLPPCRSCAAAAKRAGGPGVGHHGAMRPLLAFLLGRIVPAGAALSAGMVVAALGGLVPGIVAATVAGVGAEFVLAWIRRRTWARWSLRLALLLHVAFWSWQGVQHLPTAPARPVHLLGASTTTEPAAIEAGFGAAAFDLPPSTTLAGWGGPPRRVAFPAFAGLGPLGALTQAWQEARDEQGRPRQPYFVAPPLPDRGQALGARALVLRTANGPTLAVVSLDLVVTSRPLHERVATRLAARGVEPAGLLLCATHTHSGPGGVARGRLAAAVGTDHFQPAIEDAVVEACVAAVTLALDTMQPATLAFAHLVRAPDERAGSDRGPVPGPPEEVHGLLVRDTAGRPVGALVHLALHATVRRREWRHFDRDIAGAIEVRLGQELGGVPALFVNGAFGDVAPAATPGVAEGDARLATLATWAVKGLAEALEAAPSHARMRLGVALVERDLGTPRAVAGWGDREALLAATDRAWLEGGAEAIAMDAVTLPLNVLAWSLFLPEVRIAATLDGPALGARLALNDLVPTDAHLFSAVHLAPEDGPDCLWLTTPGEATQVAGAAWREAARQHGHTSVWTLGVVNGGCAYLADEVTMHAGGYEAVTTLYGAHTAGRVGEALDLAREASTGP